MKIIGLIPAAGQAKRLFQLPCSKELFPIGMESHIVEGKQQYMPRPVASYIIEQMVNAGAQEIVLVINREKTDILKYYGNGKNVNTHLIYVVQDEPKGMPDALNLATPRFVDKDVTFLFGMPDTIFSPNDAFSQLLTAHESQGADVTLGLFPTKKPEKFGMVAYDQQLNLLYTIDKPKETDLKYMWGIACWQPSFTHFMNEFLQKAQFTREVVLTEVFQSCIAAGLKVMVVPFENGKYTDIGTPDDLMKTISEYSWPVFPD